MIIEESYQRKTDCFKLQSDNKRGENVCCGSKSHRVFRCDKVKEISERQ